MKTLVITEISHRITVNRGDYNAEEFKATAFVQEGSDANEAGTELRAYVRGQLGLPNGETKSAPKETATEKKTETKATKTKETKAKETKAKETKVKEKEVVVEEDEFSEFDEELETSSVTREEMKAKLIALCKAKGKEKGLGLMKKLTGADKTDDVPEDKMQALYDAAEKALMAK